MSQSLYQSNRSINVRKNYRGSFGDLPGGTLYSDPMGLHSGRPVDERPHMAKQLEPVYSAIDERMQDGETFRSASSEVAKAFFGTDDITLPVFPREDLTMLATKRTPFYEALPKFTAETDSVDQDSVTGLAEPEFGGETDVPSDHGEDTIQTQSLDMSYWRIRGEVSGPMQLASAGLRNSMAGDQERKSMSMRQWAENAALNGDPTAGTTDGSLTDERGFKGVRTILADQGRDRSPSAGAGTSITTEEVRENMRLAAEDGGDMGSLINVTDLKTLTDLKNDSDEHDPLEITTVDGQRTIEFGARAIRVDGVPTVVSDYMPNAADSREFLTLDMRFSMFHNLSDLVMEALGKTQDSDDYFMKQYGVYELSAGADKYGSLLTDLA